MRIVGSSDAMATLRELLARVTPLDASLLITGETGTGKGLVAKILHASGSRQDAPMISINCGAIPEGLLEAELFGHERGAFTDGDRRRTGVILAADGGVLFLDEIDALSLPMQAKLLRALDHRTVRPLGSSEEVPFDVRVIAATNRDLRAEVARGAFRRDLYFRLRVLQLPLPPLRERRGDVVELARWFVASSDEARRRGVVGITAEAERVLSDHPWPGNVRELQNCIARAVSLSRYDLLTPDTIELTDLGHVKAVEEEELVPLYAIELDHIARVMASVEGSLQRAAEVLGIGTRALARRLRSLGLEGHGAPDGDPLVTR